MLAGGLETGAVVLWNPAAIINAESGDAAAAGQVASLAKHSGAVRAFAAPPARTGLG